jgi:hypothetical protein
MLLMRPASITRERGRGLGPGNREFLGPVKWHRATGECQYWIFIFFARISQPGSAILKIMKIGRIRVRTWP